MVRPRAVFILLLVSAFAGCSGHAPKPASTEDPHGTTALTPAGSDAVGVLVGRVVDDEEVPLANATLTLPALGPQLYTGPAGEYRFERVPVGRQQVVASKSGYTNQVRDVEVREGETADASFTLVKLPQQSSRHVSLPHDTLHIASEAAATSIIGGTGAQPNCDGCNWTLRAEEPPTFVLIEIFGEHTVPNPEGDAEHYRLFANNTKAASLLYEGVDAKLPVRQLLNASVINRTEVFWVQLLCETAWVCAQEARETWITFFYDTGREEIPSGFTGRPKT